MDGQHGSAGAWTEFLRLISPDLRADGVLRVAGFPTKLTLVLCRALQRKPSAPARCRFL